MRGENIEQLRKRQLFPFEMGFHCSSYLVARLLDHLLMMPLSPLNTTTARTNRRTIHARLVPYADLEDPDTLPAPAIGAPSQDRSPVSDPACPLDVVPPRRVRKDHAPATPDGAMPVELYAHHAGSNESGKGPPACPQSYTTRRQGVSGKCCFTTFGHVVYVRVARQGHSKTPLCDVNPPARQPPTRRRGPPHQNPRSPGEPWFGRARSSGLGTSGTRRLAVRPGHPRAAVRDLRGHTSDRGTRLN